MITVAETPEEILTGFIEPNKRVLHIGGDPRLEELVNPSEYVRIETADITDELEIPKEFDYTIISDALELIDNPISLIHKIRDSAKEVVIYEFKYDDPEWIKGDNWKKPWLTVGLEWNLIKEFDYIHNVFLGYATINICKMPNTLKEENVSE